METPEPLPLPWIGLAGRAGSGKDTVAGHLSSCHGYTKVSLADGVRDMALAIDPVVGYAHPEQYARLSYLVDSDGWEHTKRTVPEVRRLLQVIGTDAVRDMISPTAWVDLAERKAAEVAGPVVFPDVRFPNEAAMIQAHGGLVFYVARDFRHGPEAEFLHVSETAMDAYPVDGTIYNTRTRIALRDYVDSIVAMILSNS